MSERISDNVNPTADDVRQWGYDEDLYLMEQDEDLLLYGTSYAPVLLELAEDDGCPKQYYALCILSQFTRESALSGNRSNLRHLQSIAKERSEIRDAGVAEWRKYVNRLVEYDNQPCEVNEEKAKQMAQDLLLGVGRVGQVEARRGEKVGEWHFALVTSITEHLHIDKGTGAYRYYRAI